MERLIWRLVYYLALTKHRKSREQKLQDSFDRAVERVREAQTVTMKERYKQAGIKTIGYLDIETSGLTGDFDIILSYAILIRDVETGKTKIKHGIVNRDDFEKAVRIQKAKTIDKRVTKQLLDDLVGIDCLIGHWFIGKHRHDIPFIRTRALTNELKGIPRYRTVRYGDTQRLGSLLLRLHSNGLDSIAKMLNLHVHKTQLEPEIWQNACIGVKSALDYVLEHNIKDVKITYLVHKNLEELVPIPSIYA